MWNCFQNIIISWTVCFQKIFFLPTYTVKKSKLTFSHFLRKLVSESDVFGKKHALNRKLWEKSVFESISLQRLRLLNKKITSCQNVTWISTKRQNLNQDFNNASDFDEKSVFRKSESVGKLALKESFIWSIYTIKTSNLALLCILGKVVPEKVVFILYKKLLDQNF